MAGVNIQISSEGLEKAGQILSKISGDTSKVTARVINRVMDGMKTDATRETAQKYYVSASQVRQSLTFKKANAGSLMGEMISKGKRHNLADYKLSPTSPKSGKNTVIKGAVEKAVGLKTLAKGERKIAFLVKRAGGKYFLFYRIGYNPAARQWGSIRAYISPSMPQIIKNEETVKVVQEKAEERFSKRLNHEILRLFGATV